MNMKRQQAVQVDTTTEIVSLTERLGYMSLLRVGFVLVALIVVLTTNHSSVISFLDVLIMSGAYVLVTGLLEGLRRVRRVRGLTCHRDDAAARRRVSRVAHLRDRRGR